MIAPAWQPPSKRGLSSVSLQKTGRGYLQGSARGSARACLDVVSRNGNCTHITQNTKPQTPILTPPSPQSYHFHGAHTHVSQQHQHNPTLQPLPLQLACLGCCRRPPRCGACARASEREDAAAICVSRKAAGRFIIIVFVIIIIIVIIITSTFRLLASSRHGYRL